MVKFKEWFKKNVWFVLAFLCVLSIGYISGQCSTKEERKQGINNLIAARDSVRTLQVDINGLNHFVSVKDAIILDQKEAIKAGIIERDKLKALHIKELLTNADLQGTIKILRDSLKLQPGTIIITVKDTLGISHDYVRVPFTLLDIKEKYVSLSAGMNKNRTAYFDLSVPVSGELSIGYVKSGFLKTKPAGVFVSQNPYLQINNMDILIIQEKKKWFDRWYVHAIFGAAVFETGRQLLK